MNRKTVVTLVIFLFTRQVQPASDEGSIRLIFERDVKSRRSEIPPERSFEKDYSYSLEEIRIEGEWARATILTRDETGELISEPALAIFRNVEGEWQYAPAGKELYNEWFWQVPESLIPYETKLLLP